MRAGLKFRADLIYPVYVNDALVLPEHTVLTGTVTELTPNHPRRVRALLGGDFTPFSDRTWHDSFWTPAAAIPNQDSF